MTAADSVALVHLLGFVTSGALYALLALMVVRRAGAERRPAEYLAGNRLALATAVLGVIWNAGAFVFDAQRDLHIGRPLGWVAASAFAALGFLPAVVVHAALRDVGTRTSRAYVGAAYVLSGSAALLHAVDALRGLPLPSRPPLLLLTIGYLLLTAGLVLQHRRPAGPRALTAVGLAVFAVTAFHLGQHASRTESWLVAIVGHHASLPLALVILYQDYRFALADVFLKRALALVALVALAVALYLWVAVPLLGAGAAVTGAGGLRPVGVLLTLWVATALAYPRLRQGMGLLVDRVILRRADYGQVRAAVARRLEAAATETAALDEACAALAGALGAAVVRWQPLPAAASPAEALLGPAHAGRPGASVRVPTTDAPAFALDVGALHGGRRLLSDDLALLESVALLAGRRVDALRVARERYARDVREAEMRRLASEAELSALRAQLNPHFLFNTLNTLGYLMQVSPVRAQGTLHHLSELLRAVLYRSQREYCTLGEELETVAAYLAIETARFEERLQTVLDVPAALRALRVPPLLLQPLVENAVKHGVAPRRAGGTVTVAAAMDGAAGGARLRLTVRDSGAGATVAQLAAGRARGVGLANLERRLARYYGDAAGLAVRSVPGEGTEVEVWLPVEGVGSVERRASGVEGGVALAGEGMGARGAPPNSSMRPEEPPVATASTPVGANAPITRGGATR